MTMTLELLLARALLVRARDVIAFQVPCGAESNRELAEDIDAWLAATSANGDAEEEALGLESAWPLPEAR